MINQTHQCSICNSNYTIPSVQKALIKRQALPDPKACPRCRLQRRYALRNERVLYQRKCDLTQESIVTVFSPDSPYTVYSQEAWWSDKWDQMKYGRDVDFSRPFIDQMKELQLKQPRLALLGKDSENSEYTNHSAHNKDCYLGFSLVNCEKVFYGYMNFQVSYLVDCTYMYEDSELCYESFYCHKCYGCAYVTFCRGCTDCWFSFGLSGCEKCFLSWNLRNKKYCFMNEQLSEVEYDKRVSEFKNMTYQQQQDLIQLWKKLIETKAIHQATTQINAMNSTGNYLANCNNIAAGYYISDAENCANIMQGENLKDCGDVCNVAPAELLYEATGVINTNHSTFINYSYDNEFIEYCDHVFNSQYLFGCVGLNKKKYCILNMQYSKPEYNRLREKVIEHMSARGASGGEYGEFFPISYSPFPYNETVAHDLYPLSKTEALQLGATWNDDLDRPAADTAGIYAKDLPETINEIEDNIIDQTILCEETGRPYRILEEELRIYRKLGIPLPRKHHEVRFQERIKQRSAPQLYNRQCSKCATGLISTFSATRPEQVYCGTCYRNAIY